MIKLTKEDSDALLKGISVALNADNVIIVYGDHMIGKLDAIMRVHPIVDPLNFGENAIDVIREFLRRVDRAQKEANQEQAKTE